MDFRRPRTHNTAMDASRGWAADVIPQERSFVVVNQVSARWDYQVHNHGCFELIAFPRGDGYTVIGDASGAFSRGELYLLAPGVPHCFYSQGFMPSPNVLEMLCAYFRPELVDVTRVPELAPTVAMLARARRGLRFGGPLAAEVAGILREVAALPPGPDALIRFYAALDRLARSGEGVQISEHEVSSRFNADEMRRLDAVRAVIARRYREGIGLEAVAKETGIGATSLNQLMRKYLQQTFLDYLTGIRLGEAKRLLRESERDIIDIALDAGFGSLATFNRRFRARESRSPQEYRLAHR
jgi:AraC-like DNA-binding protein